MKTPRFDGILAGTTVKRAYDLKDSLLENKIINGFEFCDLTEKDALEAAEMIMFGGGYCVPIVEMDGRKIGNGTPGMVYQAIDNLLVKDMLSEIETDAIPYA